MALRHWAIAALVLAMASGMSSGQSKPDAAIKTTVCELVKTPERFNGGMVEFRGEYLSKFQSTSFVDPACSAKIQVGAFHVLDDLKPEQGQYAFTTLHDDNTHPDRLDWKPIRSPLTVHLKKDDNYDAFRKYADQKFRWPDGGICEDCPLYRLIVTVTGRFDYFETQTVAVRATPTTKAFIYSAGDPDAPLLRFVLESVSDLATTPIAPSVYTNAKPRNISLEEAHELVKAFQNDHGEGGYGLQKYEVKEYPGFEFFQAVPDPPSGRIHYSVDLRTGEVWDEGSCEKLTSPSLKRLQSAIRNRIGLTADEYRNIGRPCPFCEQ